jgi:hypothetical protein
VPGDVAVLERGQEREGAQRRVAVELNVPWGNICAGGEGGSLR